MREDSLSIGAGLADRGVIVTGAASGIGRATMQLAADCGARVCGVDMNGPALRAAMAKMDDAARHVALEIDLTDADAPQSVVETALQEFGDLWGLVHCAGVLIRQENVAEVTAQDWDIQHGINLRASFFLNQAAGEALKARGGGGRMVNLSSQAWWTGGSRGALVYAATKGGVVSMSRGLSTAYAPHGILVNSIAPGLVDAPMVRVGLTPADLQAVVDASPLGRLADPMEIARVAVFLLSTQASFISGAAINVGGGILLY